MTILKNRFLALTAGLVLSGCHGASGNRQDTAQEATMDERGEVSARTAESGGWETQIVEALDGTYGGSGVGFSSNRGDAAATYVHLYPANDHIVYVTSGSHRRKFPHEFVLRVRFDSPPEGEKLWETAPMWPVQALSEIARVEPKMDRPFAPGNHLSNMVVEGKVLGYRHFAFLTDPVLLQLSRQDTDQPLVFVQVVPLTDQQEAAIAAIPTGATNTVLEEWASRDKLFLVGDPER